MISIVQFVDQHRLGPTWKLLHEHQVKDESGRVTGYTQLEKIGQTVAPIMIRRRKSEVLTQLPARTDQNLLVPMTERQMTYHQENAEMVTRIVQRWRRMKFLSDIDQRRLTCALQNMRMSCNSTYLLDQETDHGLKADELAALLDGLFAEPDAKAVVFSQWTRTHDIVIRRLEARGIGYVSFHGGVASEKRPSLVDRFRDDPDCRVFLSTDAGATGLNLQHASTLVNMDLPWNPALLEQRIGRIYRMGQQRPVQIVNFVAKGTIEEGMLSVLAFKRSLSAGILDGGTSEISLGGSRLNRFMKEVEKVTGRMPEGETITPAEEALGLTALPTTLLEEAPVTSTTTLSEAASATVIGSDAEVSPSEVKNTQPRGQEETGQVGQSQSDPWQALTQIGAELVAALSAAGSPSASDHPWIERDSRTGKQSLRLPLPPPETASKIADALLVLADALRGKRP
nr:RNA polymerase-associated protein RapA [Cupriavidus sp.]